MKIKILDLLLDARHDVVMNAFEKFTFTLFLLLCGLLPSPFHAEASQKLLEVEKWSPEGDTVALRNIQL